MSKQPTSIVIDNPVVTKRIAEMITQRDQINVALTHTVRTVADMLNVPEGWQFDPLQGAFVPEVERVAAEVIA